MKTSIIYMCVLILFVLFASNSANVILEKPDGKALYKAASCATCHGRNGKSMLNIAPSLQNPALTLKKRIEIITNGSETDPTMVAFSSKYTTDEIKAIAEYTMTFVKNNVLTCS